MQPRAPPLGATPADVVAMIAVAQAAGAAAAAAGAAAAAAAAAMAVALPFGAAARRPRARRRHLLVWFYSPSSPRQARRRNFACNWDSGD